MRILITGGCGFLGSHLVDHFLRAHLDDGDGDTEIVVVDKLSDACGFDRLRDVTSSSGLTREAMHARVRTLGGVDLANPLSAGAISEIGIVDYVIHAAGEGDIDESINDPLRFIQANVLGTHNLLAAVHDGRFGYVKRVFMVSTAAVYGSDLAGCREGGAFRPSNPYAASMAAAESIAMGYEASGHCPVTIVNATNLIGERQRPSAFIPTVIRGVLAGDTVRIHANASHSYQHARTFAHAVEYMLEGDHYYRKRDNSIDIELPIKVHVGGGPAISNLDLAHAIARILGKTLMWEAVERPRHRDARYSLRSDLIKEFGWTPPVEFEFPKAIESTVNWYVNNPHWLETGRQ